MQHAKYKHVIPRVEYNPFEEAPINKIGGFTVFVNPGENQLYLRNNEDCFSLFTIKDKTIIETLVHGNIENVLDNLVYSGYQIYTANSVFEALDLIVSAHAQRLKEAENE